MNFLVKPRRLLPERQHVGKDFLRVNMQLMFGRAIGNALFIQWPKAKKFFLIVQS